MVVKFDSSRNAKTAEIYDNYWAVIRTENILDFLLEYGFADFERHPVPSQEQIKNGLRVLLEDGIIDENAFIDSGVFREFLRCEDGKGNLQTFRKPLKQGDEK